MDDFGDYIYLIAIVIAALSSLLKKKKPAQRDLQEDTMPDLDDVIPDIEEEEYIPQREPVQRQETVHRPEPVKRQATVYRPLTAQRHETIQRHEPAQRQESVHRQETIQREESIHRQETIQREESVHRQETIQREESIHRQETVQRQEPVYRNERYKTEEQYTPRHTTPLPKPEYTQSKQAEKVQVKYESVADFVKLKAQRTTKPVHHLVKSQETLEVAVEPEFYVEFDTAEDVKRAFVYSEIFNRKY